ncbi:hypothetical protein GGH12_003375 [Coemansia sp. RSA 1822]|nr:hypothetical protein GGH12_003375 [Coemansia sp. RSA 1822]
MDVQPKPLLNYAKELQQSYSRLIVYSGDILRALPEPREGLSAANFKTKKDESTAFLREWQHLESVLDEYLVRLNDIRTRAHEELDAARVRCLAGANIDLTLPEAVVKLTSRLTKYKQQYDVLQKVKSGCLEDIAQTAVDQDTCMDDSSITENDSVVPVGAPSHPSDHMAANIENAVEGDKPKMDSDLFDASEETKAGSQPESVIDVDAEDDDELFQGSPNTASNEPIELGSDSDIDDDAMEDIFDS